MLLFPLWATHRLPWRGCGRQPADSWFKIDDVGWCSADGYHTITGRARELIITGGYNVYPREIEDALGAIPEVAEVAVIVPKPGCSPDPSQLIAYCRERLAAYKKPRKVIFVDSLPRNALGKVPKTYAADQSITARGRRKRAQAAGVDFCNDNPMSIMLARN